MQAGDTLAELDQVTLEQDYASAKAEPSTTVYSGTWMIELAAANCQR